MTAARLFAIGFIVVCTSVAWFVLGGTVVSRTGESDAQLAREVAQLWGGRHEQRAPEVVLLVPRTETQVVEETDSAGQKRQREVRREVVDERPEALSQSKVAVGLNLDQRRKGLLWYDTYAVAFSGRYRFHNSDVVARTAAVRMAFPSPDGIYDGFVFRVNGKEAAAVADLAKGISLPVRLEPGEEASVELAYRSRGLGDWTYSFGSTGGAQVRNFALEMTTDFADIDFPVGTLSPSRREPAGQGFKLSWTFDNLVTGQKIGMDPPNKLNPGPFAARVTFFAPVSLLFFVTVLVILGALRGRSLHPMNYFFLAAAFFAFHLLLAYLVDHVSVHAAFAIAAATSVFLVVSYLRLVAGLRFAVLEAGAAQLVFLVLFSYAFFFEGYTGLTVTVGAVLTLFVLMQMTGRLDWGQVFARQSSPQLGGAPQEGRA